MVIGRRAAPVFVNAAPSSYFRSGIAICILEYQIVTAFQTPLAKVVRSGYKARIGILKVFIIMNQWLP